MCIFNSALFNVQCAVCSVRDDTESNPDICRHHSQSEAAAAGGEDEGERGWGGKGSWEIVNVVREKKRGDEGE